MGVDGITYRPRSGRPRILASEAFRIPRPVPEPPDRDLWIAQREDCAAELSDKLFDSFRQLLASPETLRSACTTHSP
ncbi:MAG: hypothetical protein RLZZ505_2871 [Verrucomicrobiota bacterium]|jgi:hypothetical protein